MIVQKLDRAQLVHLLERLAHPSPGDSEERGNELLLTFCLNCPDPVRAMDLIVETPPGLTHTDVVDQAMAMEARDVSSWPTSELTREHPLRHWKTE